MEKILKVSDVSGGHNDGSKNGAFIAFNVAPGHVTSYSLTQDLWCEKNGTGGGAYDAYGSWLRFTIPFDPSDNVTFDDVRLRLYWRPFPDVGIANFGQYDKPDGIEIRIYGPDDYGGGDSPIPADGTIAKAQWAAASIVKDWSSDPLDDDLGESELLYIESIDLSAELTALLAQSAWTKNDTVTLFFAPDLGTIEPSQHRGWRFRSYGRDYEDSGSVIAEQYQPTLRIQYTQGTPLPATYDKHVEHTLNFEQDIVVTGNHWWLQHNMGFEQDISHNFVYNRTVEHTLDVTQTISFTRTIATVTVEHNLGIEQTIGVVRTLNRSLEHDLTIVQTIDHQAPLNVSLYSDLDITQEIARTVAFPREVEHVLGFAQDIRATPFTQGLEHILAITQDASATLDTSAPTSSSDTLSLTQDIVGNFTRYRTVEHTLTIEQFFTGDNGVTGGCSAEHVWEEAPTLLDGTTLLLEYPHTGSPTNSVTLEAPLFGNRESIETTRIQRELKGGQLSVYRDASWPDRHVFRFAFQNVTTVKRDDLVTFLLVSLGEPVKLTDHEGRIWTGLITNPNGEFATIQDDDCSHTFEFVFRVLD